MLEAARRIAVPLVGWLVPLALLPACDFWPFYSKPESHVEYPTTIKELKALHQPPAVTVKVVRRKVHGKGVPCHSSAVCVVLLPFMLKDALFPKRYDEVTVTRKGIKTYQGTFKTNGQLIHASVRKGSQLTVLRTLHLKELGKKVIVEVSRATVDPAGKVIDQTPVPILKQVDLLADYRRALNDEKDADDRVDLLVEAWLWLRSEAMPLWRERLPKEKDADRAKLLSNTCSKVDQPTDRATLIDILVKAKGPASATALLDKCHRPWTLDDDSIQRLLGVVIDALCDQRQRCHPSWPQMIRRRARGEANLPPQPAAYFEARIARCAPWDRRVVLELAANKAPAQARLVEAATRARRPIRECLSAILDPGVVDHRRVLYAGLAAATDSEEQRRLANRLAARLLPADGGQTKILLDTYLGAKSTLVTKGYLLTLLSTIEKDAIRASARARLLRALAKAPRDQRSALRAALVVLGKDDEALAAVREAKGRRTILLRVPSRPSEISRPVKLVAYALTLRGCRSYDVREVLGKVVADEKVARSLCIPRKPASPAATR